MSDFKKEMQDLLLFFFGFRFQKGDARSPVVFFGFRFQKGDFKSPKTKHIPKRKKSYINGFIFFTWAKEKKISYINGFMIFFWGWKKKQFLKFPKMNLIELNSIKFN